MYINSPYSQEKKGRNVYPYKFAQVYKKVPQVYKKCPKEQPPRKRAQHRTTLHPIK